MEMRTLMMLLVVIVVAVRMFFNLWSTRRSRIPHARGALLSNFGVHAPFIVVVRPWYRVAIPTCGWDAGERISFSHGFVASIRTTWVIWLAELLHRVHDA